jgi:hypothetical protein
MGQYYAKRSRLNVLSHLRQLCIFCASFNVTFLPVSRDTLLGFTELMSRTCGFEHISHILSSVKFLHKYTGHDYPGDSFEFSILMRGLKRKLAKPAKQALPITPEMLILMYQNVNISNQRELAHWTSFIFALRLLYRKSSIGPVSLGKFDPKTGLSREKALLTTNNVVLVYQNHYKTNQFMSSTRITPLMPSPVQALDPVFHYSRLVCGNIVPANYPAFSYYEAGLIKCVTHKSFSDYLKLLLQKIGVDPNRWTGHSFRRGGASLLYRLGLDPLTIQACGDWSSDTFLRYIEVNFDQLWSAQHTMASFTCL